jgi:BASS family bile acid:Na+ symporter
MQKFINLLFNRNFIFIITILSGFIFPGGAGYLKSMVLPILAIVMTFSLTGIYFNDLFPLKQLVRPMITGVLLCYVILGLLIILLVWLISPSEEFYPGFIVVAAAPCGVGVIPFALILKGDVKFAAFGVMGSYLASFIIAPLFFKIMLSSVQIPYDELLKILLILIIIPFIFSRLLLIKPFRKIIPNIRGKVVNFGFGIVIYTVIGLNKDVLFYDSALVLPVFIIAFLTTFGIGNLYYWINIKLLKNRNKGQVISNMLMVSIKNNGFAIAITVVLFPSEAGIPPVVSGITLVLYFLFLSYKFRDKGITVNGKT